MSNRNQENIKLRDIFGPTLSTRQAVKVIVDRIPADAKEVVIDFSEISFISRSFAHEFLRLQENSAVPMKTANVCGEVEQIIALVSKSREQNKPHDHDDEITDTSVSLSDHSLAF